MLLRNKHLLTLQFISKYLTCSQKRQAPSLACHMQSERISFFSMAETAQCMLHLVIVNQNVWLKLIELNKEDLLIQCFENYGGYVPPSYKSSLHLIAALKDDMQATRLCQELLNISAYYCFLLLNHKSTCCCVLAICILSHIICGIYRHSSR